MAPGLKRKRGDRQDSYEQRPRQSPYRPEDSQYGRRQPSQASQAPQSAAYNDSQYQGRGGRRGPRGGRGGHHQAQQPKGAHAASGTANATRSSATANALENDADKLRSSASSPAPTDTAPAQSSSIPARTTQVQLPPPPPPEPTEPPPPSEPPAPYTYDFLTEDKIQSWQETGRAEIISSTTTAIQSGDTEIAETTCMEILRAGLDAKIEALDAGKTVQDILASLDPEQYDEAASMFLDTLSVLTETDIENTRIHSLLLSTKIPSEMMRQQLEYTLLKSLRMVSNAFDRMFIRKQTHLLYKQSNYNLLREETEGYSKLVTELFNTTSSQPPTSEVVEDTFENMKALIGAFDLDAGRVLDVTLDVFANLLVKHYRFFVRLLRQSSWWPAEEKIKGLDTARSDVSSLPPWAQPEYPDWQTSEEDLVHTASMKRTRDEMFWERARQIGMDAFFELGGQRVINAEDIDIVLKAAEDDDGDEARVKETKSWIKSTGTLPTAGNPVAAQLLGFKLKFYASAARDAQDALPVNLIYLSALLIKIGFVSLRDLYTHLWPGDEDFAALKDKKLKEKEERDLAKRPGGGANNALARAGALADDTLPPPAVSRLRAQDTARASTPSKTDEAKDVKKEEEAKERLPEPKDQKVELLKSLFCIGAIPEVLYLLGRFPWLIDGYPELVDSVHRILHHSLSKVYREVCPLIDRDGLRQPAKHAALDQHGVPKGEVILNDTSHPKVLKWAQPDRKDVSGVDYEFYWQEWSDNVPVCQNVDDLFTLCSTLLNISGHKVGQDPSLMMKLARIGKRSLSEDTSSSNRTRWLDLCKRLLVPALSLTGCNPSVVNEMYDLLKYFDTPTRYSIYTEWFNGPTSRLPDIASAFDQAKAETKDVMKRMSKTNMRAMARLLAKVACASPGVVFQTVFRQIESYTNLIDVVVECGRYFTYMSYDVLTWTLLTTLGGAGRSRISQNTGTTVSLWLMALSQFTGKVFKRYSVMTSLPVLQYVLAQLQLDNFVDLQVLRELCVYMGGIAPDTDFTEAQVQAMAGGELLQAQTLKSVLDKRHESGTTGKRLTRTLVDHNIAGPMLVAIAQQRQKCIFNSGQNQVKAVSENFDGVNIVLQQFLDLLRHNTQVKDFDALVPDVTSLISEYGIEPSIAFMIHRKSIAKAIDEYNAAHPEVTKKKRTSGAQVNGSTSATKASAAASASPLKDAEDQAMTDSDDKPADDQELVKQLEAVAGEVDVNPDTEEGKQSSTQDVEQADIPMSEDDQQPTEPSFWHPVLQDLSEKLRHVLPDDLVESMSMPFFVSFWQLSIGDLHLHTQSYTDEVTRQKDRISTISADRTDPSAAAARRKESDKKRIRDFISQLTDEMRGQMAHHRMLRTRLENEKVHWFDGLLTKSAPLITALLQECFLPRMFMSPLDSYFCWKMFNLMHSSGTPGFRTVHFIDVLMNQNRLANLMFQCTGREAENFGRFLYELLKELGSWHTSKTEYEKKAFGAKRTLPGFATKMSKEGVPEKLLDYEDFRQLLYKWHAALQRAARQCIDNGEYMHMKNAIVVLKGVQRVYPQVNWMGNQLCDSLRPYTLAPKQGGKEDREDVRVLSNSLMGLLMSKKKTWVLPQAFRSGMTNEDPQKGRSQSRATSQAPKTPQAPRETAGADGKALDARATPFEPNSTPVNDAEKSSDAGENAAGDGELQSVSIGSISAIQVVGSSEVQPPSAPAAMSVESASTKRDSKAILEETRQKLMASMRRGSQPSDAATKPSALANDRAPTPLKSEASAPPQAPQGPARSTNSRVLPAIPSGPAHPSTRQDQQQARNSHDTRRQPEGPRGSLANGNNSTPTRFDGPSGRRDHENRPDSRQAPAGPSRGYDDDRRSRADEPAPRRAEPELSATQVASSAGHLVDPARAAMMAGRDSQRSSYGPPSERDRDAHDGRRSQQQSPSRGARDDTRSAPRGSDSRQDVRPPQDSRVPPSSRDCPTDQAPSGPRGNAGPRQPGDSQGRPVDIMRPPPSRMDRDRGSGRFQDDSRSQPRHRDENYGRLTSDDAFPNSPAGSPPRDRRGPEVNSGTPSQPQFNRRHSNGAVPVQAQASSVPEGIHPSRLASFQATSAAPSPAPERPTSASAEQVGIHPSRLARIDQRPQPIQTVSPTTVSPTTSVPPSGPRSANLRGNDVPPHPPQGPRNGAGLGPAADRRGSGPVDRRFMNMQDTIAGRGAGPQTRGSQQQPAQIPDQGISIRGSASGPSGPPLQPQAQQSQADLFANRRGGGTPAQAQVQRMPDIERGTPSSDRRSDHGRSEREPRESRDARDSTRGRDRDLDRDRDRSRRSDHRSSREHSHARTSEREHRSDRDREPRSDRDRDRERGDRDSRRDDRDRDRGARDDRDRETGRDSTRDTGRERRSERTIGTPSGPQAQAETQGDRRQHRDRGGERGDARDAPGGGRFPGRVEGRPGQQDAEPRGRDTRRGPTPSGPSHAGGRKRGFEDQGGQGGMKRPRRGGMR